MVGLKIYTISPHVFGETPSIWLWSSIVKSLDSSMAATT